LYKIEILNIRDAVYGNLLLKKEFSYSEFVTEQDKTEIINIIGNYLNQFIETHGFTNKML
jgi:hypothetical protein